MAYVEDITNLLKVDWQGFLLTFITVVVGVKAVIELVSKIKKKLRIKTGSEISKEQLNERVATLEKHDNWQYGEITKIANCVQEISAQLSRMQVKMDETEMAKLKDSIVGYYKTYKERGYWNSLEKDAFWSLFKRYEAHGGNGYVHETIEPVMHELEVRD